MNILWFTWKDKRHPQAGGAETVNEELAKRLARDGYKVIFVVGGFENCEKEETRDGFKIIRLGNRWTVYWKAYRYYKKNLKGWADVVIDEINTMPFFCSWYVKEKNIMFVHQLCREIWFYQMFFPFNWIGYWLEPVYLRLLNANTVVTISQSTKDDLIRYSFDEKRVHVVQQGMSMRLIENLDTLQKYAKSTMLSLGAIREMKQTLDQIKVFEIAKKNIPELQMKVAGDATGSYGQKVLQYIEKSPYKNDIEYFGRVSQEQKMGLMQKSHCIVVTSVKEGWGLIVTEANSQGTPAIGYDTDGLRDSIRDGETGILSKENTPESLAQSVVELFQNSEKYDTLRESAWHWSRIFNFKKSYKEFVEILTM